jgi:pimeloyl-ACP methyl ester carboxylesterase
MLICTPSTSIYTQSKTASKFWAHNSLVVGNKGSQNIRFTETRVVDAASQRTKRPPIVCIHGFGGNADQFRLNVPVLAEAGYDTYAIDLLGYGYSDKPNPKEYAVNEVYNFNTWADQTRDFINEVVGEPCVLVCNSVGGVVGLNTAVKYPETVKGLLLIDISLRMLHTRKQSAFQVPLTTALQTVLRETALGKAFFDQVATPKALKNILNQAYGKSIDVTDETVDLILKPGLAPGAADVFLDFISYSSGPLPEDLFPLIDRNKCPVRILWGEKDPWEPIEMGRELYGPYADEFVTLKDAGHCPMDQTPAAVNAEILRFLSENDM